MLSLKQVTFAWILLLGMTLIAVFIPQLTADYEQLGYGATIALVVATTVIKGQQITDIFMGLKKAPLFWRILLLAYVMLVPTITGSIIAFA